jgi:hypothetical protein
MYTQYFHQGILFLSRWALSSQLKVKTEGLGGEETASDGTINSCLSFQPANLPWRFKTCQSQQLNELIHKTYLSLFMYHIFIYIYVYEHIYKHSDTYTHLHTLHHLNGLFLCTVLTDTVVLKRERVHGSWSCSGFAINPDSLDALWAGTIFFLLMFPSNCVHCVH